MRASRRDFLTPFCGSPQASQRTDRELVVTGSLTTYRIDLATANVQTDPAGKWLSFDTGAAPARQTTTTSPACP